MLVLVIFFWLSVFLIFHSYLFYPLMLKALSANKKVNDIRYARDEDLPVVSVIISAFNEEEVIAEKIESIFAGDYPEDKLEVLIGSDSSNDRTAEIINNYLSRHSNLIFNDFKERRGKQNVVNDLVLEYFWTNAVRS